MGMICVNNICFSYGETKILEGITFEIASQEILCLIGPNGSGKSTLLDCILGLNKVNDGCIKIIGKDIKKYKASELAKYIAYVPQKQTISFPFKVLDMVVMGRSSYIKAFSTPSEDDVNRAKEAIEYVGLKGFEDRFYNELSGGEAQLVMIARAITQDSKYIIMDEPTAHLDFHNELMILELICKLIKSKKISVIMATHFPNHAYYFTNQGIDTRVGILNKKKIEIVGNPEEVLTESKISKVFKIKSKVLKHNENNREYNHIIPLLTEK
jgi:iron complex transport system ATP-binding protein